MRFAGGSKRATVPMMLLLLMLMLRYCAHGATVELRFADKEAAQVLQAGGRQHRLSVVTLVPSNESTSSTFNLSISCQYGAVSIPDKTSDLLSETSFACLNNADKLASSNSFSGNQQTTISAFATLGEAQRILSSLIYEPPAPESCRMPRGATEDLLTVRIEQLKEGPAMSRWSMGGDVCNYDPASLLSGESQLFSSDGQVVLERRLILPSDSLLSTQLIQISTENAPIKYTQGACAALPSIQINIAAEKVSTQEGQYPSVHFGEANPEDLVVIKLSVPKGTLQLSIMSALKNRVRILGVNLDPQTPPLSASSFTLRGVLSDLQTFLSTIRYCSTSIIYAASDTLDVDVGFNGMCSTFRDDGDLVKAHTSISIPIERMIDLGKISLLSPMNSGGDAAPNLLILGKNQLFMPLAVQYAPGNVDDITVEMRLSHNNGFSGDDEVNGVLVGVEANPLSGVALVPDLQHDVSTYTQTITRTQSSSSAIDTQALAGEPERFSLRSSHSSWLNTRQAELPVAFTEGQLKQAFNSLLFGDLKPSVNCKADFGEVPTLTTVCTIEYHDVNLVSIPNVSLGLESSTPALLTGRLSVSALNEKKKSARTGLETTDLKNRKWCGVHVEFPDQTMAAPDAPFQFTRKICALAQSCRVATTRTFASFTSLASHSSAQQDVLQSIRDQLSVDGENLESTQLFLFQEEHQSGFLVSNLPCTLAYSLAVQSKDNRVKIRVLSRQLQLRAPKEQVAAALSAARVYSIAFGVRLHNLLTVTLQETEQASTTASANAVTTFDVLVLPNYQNLQLTTPPELVVREGSDLYVNLSSISITAPWTKQISSAGVRAYCSAANADGGDEQFRWTIHTKVLRLLYDNFSPSLLSVIHRQLVDTELQMRGSIADFQASMSAVSLGLSSALLRDKAFFRGTIERQVVQLASIPQKGSKIQTLTTSRVDSAIAGFFVLGAELPEGYYAAINMRIPSGVTCSSAPIQRSDDMSMIALKVLGMACGPTLPVDFAFKREVQVIRVSAVFPFQAADLVGSFSLGYLGATSTTKVPVGLTDAVQMRLKILEVVPDSQIQVSRVDFESGDAFEWRITFGALTGRAPDQIRAVPAAISTSFTTQVKVAQQGLHASDVTLGLLFPTTTLRVRDTSTPLTNSEGGAISLTFYFMGANADGQPSEFPDLMLLGSSLENAITHLPLTASLRPSSEDNDPGSSSPGAFRISVFGRVTDPIPVNANASDVEAAIQGLHVDKLDLVSVHRVSSSERRSGMNYYHYHNWTIEASHPLLLDVKVIDQELRASSWVHIQVTRLSRGQEVLVGSDTLSLSLSTLDSPMVIAHRDVPVRVEKTEMELAVRLPISFVSVKRNESVLIDGIVLDGFEDITLTLQIESRDNGGSLVLLPKEKQAESIDTSSRVLTRQGPLSELNAVLNTHHVIYSALISNTPASLDEIRISLRSASAEAIQVIPVEVVAPAEAPMLLLPVTQLAAEEAQDVDIRGLKLFFGSSSADGDDRDTTMAHDGDYHLMLRESARIVRILIQARVGYLTLSSSSSSSNSSGRRLRETNPERWSSIWKREVEIIGSMSGANAELSRLRYSASLLPANKSSTRADVDDDGITFTTSSVDDSSSGRSPVLAKSFQLAVLIRRRPAVAQILFDGTVLSDYDQLSTLQDQAVAFHNTSVRVVKGGFPTKQQDHVVQLDLSISAVYGTFALDVNNVNTSSAFDDFSASLTTPFEVRLLTANASTINRLLGVLQYAPKRNFNGPDQIIFRIKQAEATKTSDALVEETTGVLSVIVDPVYCLPQWEWKSSGSNVSTLRVATTYPQVLPGFKILDTFDDDQENPQLPATTTNFFEDQMVLRAVVYASIGTLLHDSASTQSGNGVDVSAPGASVTLEGRVADLKKTISQVRYQLTAPLSFRALQTRGNETVTVTFTDISRQFTKNSRYAAADQAETAVVATLLLDIADQFRMDWELDRVLKVHEMTTEEDHDVRIGDALDLRALNDYDSLVEMEFVVRTGNLYLLGVAAAVNTMTENDGRKSLKITAENGKKLQKLVSELFYSPQSDFNGFDFVQSRVLRQESELIVRVLPVNDDPKLAWAVTTTTNNKRQWFNDPALLIPGLVVDDPDTSDVYDVQIDATNGSLLWQRDAPKELFDGVTMRIANSSSLRLKTTLQRLNMLLSEPQLRFVSQNVLSTSPESGAVRICVHDGTTSACEELKFPIRRFYEVQIESKAQQPLKVFHHQSFNLSDVVRINQFHFEAFAQDADDDDDEPVILQIDSSTGSFVTNSFDLSCADEYESRSELLGGNGGGVTRVIHASGIDCVNAVLATATYSPNPLDRNSSVARLQFQLFNTEMELLAVGTLNLQIALVHSKTKRLVVTAAMTNASSFSSQQQLKAISWGSDYAKLADFAAVVIQPDSIDAGGTEDWMASKLGGVDDLIPDDDGDMMLELAFKCSFCRFFYSKYIPGVSYEFAATQGASEMRFIGSESGLNHVLAMLQVDLQKRPRQEGEDIIHLTLAPHKFSVERGGNSQNGRELNWNDTSAVPITLAHNSRRKSSLEWQIPDTQLVFRDVGRGESVFLHGVALSGDDVSSSNSSSLDAMALTIWIECVFGSSFISFDSDGGAKQQQVCEPNQPPIEVSITRKLVNRVLSTVQVTPNTSSFDRVDLQLSYITDDVSLQSAKAPLLNLYFPTQTSASDPILILKTNQSLHAVEDETVDLSDWVSIQGARGTGSNSHRPEGSGGENDDDDELFVATLAVQHGTVRVQSDVCCVYIRTTLAGHGVELLGTIATIQTALDGIQYTGDLDFAGDDMLHATIERFIDEFEGATTITDSSSFATLTAVDVAIFVEPVNDPPVIHYLSFPHVGMENNSSSATMFSLESIEIVDVDLEPTAERNSLLSFNMRVNLSSEMGEFVLLDADAVLGRVKLVMITHAEEQRRRNSSRGSFTELVFEASVADTNFLIQRTLFSVNRASLAAACTTILIDSAISVMVDDLGHNIKTWKSLQTSVHIGADYFGCGAVVESDFTESTVHLAFPDQQQVYDPSERTISVAGLSIVGTTDDEDDYTSSQSPTLHVTGTCKFSVELEVQRVSIVAPRQKQELLLTIWNPNGSGSQAPVSGTFSVQVDLAFAGVHLQQTATIYADAVAMRTQELLGEVGNGRTVSESIEAKLLQLYGPIITIANPHAVLQFHVKKVSSPPPTATVQWKISILSSPLLLQTPTVTTTNLIGTATGASITIDSSVIGAPLGGTFRLRLGDEVTREIPSNTSDLELQDALEALHAVEIVKATTLPPLNSGLGSETTAVSSWLVTFFSPSEGIPLLVGDSTSRLAPNSSLSDADASVTLVNSTKIHVERVSTGKGQGNLYNVVVGITRVDPMYRVVTNADSRISGTFKLGFQGFSSSELFGSTSEIASNAVAMQTDEGQLQSFGGRKGESMQSKLTYTLTQLNPDSNVGQWRDVRVVVSREPQNAVTFGYEWLITFVNAPPDFPVLVVTNSDELEGTNAQVTLAVIPKSVNRLGGSVQLSYRRRSDDRKTTTFIPVDSSPDAVEVALNDALSPSSSTLSAFVGRVVVRKTRVDGDIRSGFSFGILFLDEVSSALPNSSSAAGDLNADGSQLTGLGAFARVDALRTRSSGGSFELLATGRRGGSFADSNSISNRWSREFHFESLPDAFVLESRNIAALQLGLSSIVYNAPDYWYGNVQLQFSLELVHSDDGGGSGGGGRDSRRRAGAGKRRRHLSSVAISTVPLEFQLPIAEIVSDDNAFAIEVTGEIPRRLNDFTIHITGASSATATAWFKLRLSCEHGQLNTLTKRLFSTSEQPESSGREVWINGTLTHIHEQLQSIVTYVGAARGLSSPSDQSLDHLTFSLFALTSQQQQQEDTKLTESVFLVKLTAPPVIPQLHIANSIEGPFASSHWQVADIALEHGDTLDISGIWIEDANSDSSGGDNYDSEGSITLEVACEYGSLRFSRFDDHLLRKTLGSSGKPTRLALRGGLQLLNQALAGLKYESEELNSFYYSDSDVVRLSVRNDVLATTQPVAPDFKHERMIHLSIQPKVPVPRVNLGSSTYFTSYEDTGFRFPDLSLEFPDLDASTNPDSAPTTTTSSNSSSYYHRLWSTELLDSKVKYLYPRADKDDGRHRWIHDFPGRAASSPSPAFSVFCANGNVFFFQGNDEIHGRELWVSDGSHAGTRMLLDLVPGPKSSEPAEMALLNNKVLFAASGVDLSWSLGTDSCNGFRASSLHGDKVVYVVTKSSSWTPSAEYDCLPGYRWATTAEASRLFPTDEEQKQRRGHPQRHNLSEPYVFWSSCQWSGYTFGGVQRKHFRFADSRISGALKHAGRRDSAPIEVSFATTDFAGIVCIKSASGSVTGVGAGRELWITDGTTQNTKRVVDLQPGNESSNPKLLTPFKSSSLLLFQAKTHDYGAELYKTDGTATGTILVEDIWRGPRSSSPSSFAEWTVGDGRMYFAATTDNGRELWATDGFSSFSAERLRKSSSGASLVSGTSLVRDICPGSSSSDPRFLTATGLGVFFSADDCVHGRELWITDGSPSGIGTHLVTDLNPVAGEGSNPSHFVLYSSKLYFQAQASSQVGFELYVSDGTAAGTLLLADLVPGPASSSPSFLSNLLGRDKSGTIVSSALYFSAVDAVATTVNLWKSDGSPTGTAPLLDEIFLHEQKLRLDASTAGGAVRGIFTFQNAMYYFMESSSSSPSPSLQNHRVLNNDKLYQLSITVSSGRISSTNNILNSSDTTEPIVPASFINVTGSFAELVQVLDGLVYLLDQNWDFHTSTSQSAGSKARGYVVEWLFSVQHGDRVQETYADLLIAPRVDAPVIQVPMQLSVNHAYHSMGDFLSSLCLSCLPLQCDEDSPVSLRGLYVRSADDRSSSDDSTLSGRLSTLLLSLNMSVSHGKLAFADTKCIGRQLLSSFPMESPQKQVAFETDARCMNTVLSSAFYMADPNFSGSDFLKVHVANTASGKSDQVTIPLVVREINDAPYLVTSSSEYYECDEDISLIIRDFRIVDPDIPADLDAIRVEIRATFGSLALLQYGGVRLNADAQQTTLTLRGTLHDVNSALSTIVYTSPSDWNSVDTTFDDDNGGFDAITVAVSDNNSPFLLPSQSFNSSSISVRFVYVRPIADPVVISTPGNAPSSDHAGKPLGSGVRGDEDTWLQVHSLSFSSVDDTSRLTLIVSLIATHGAMTLSSSSSSSSSTLSGVTFLDNTRNGEKNMHFKGTFASLNNSVRDLRYFPDQNFNGRDEIIVTAVSIDEYTLEESQETTLTIPVQIDAVNDPPIWDVGSSATDAIIADAKSSTLIKGVQLRDVDVTDALCSTAAGALLDACEMDVVIEVAHGTISLARLLEEAEEDELITTDKVRVIVQDAGYLTLSGTLEHLNYVLHEIVFTLDDIETTQTAFRALNEIQLVLTVDDRGTYGKGGPQVSSAVIHLVLADGEQQKLRGLSLVMPTESVIAMQEDTIFAFNGSITLHDADAALSTAASLLEMTISAPNGVFAIASGPVPGIQLVRNDTTTTVLRGFLAQMNVVLTNGAYIPARDWYGSEQILISVVDVTRAASGASRRASAALYLAVTPICDEPTWRSLKEVDNGAFATLREDEKLLIDELSLTCPDAQADEREVAVQIVARHGGVMLATYEGLLLQEDAQQFKNVSLVGLGSAQDEENAVTESRLFFSRLKFRGRLQDVNTALKGLIYELNLHFHTNGGLVEEIELLATSGCGATGLSGALTQLSGSSAFTIRLRIQAANDPPTLLSKDFVLVLHSNLDNHSFESLVSALPPPAIEATENTNLLLDPLLVQDPDQVSSADSSVLSELQLLVNISCVHCSIRSSTPLSKLLEQHGLFISLSTTTTPVTAAANDEQEQSSTQVLLAQGGISALNNPLLSSLVFRSAANFYGVALIVVQVSDLGNSGQGGVLTSTYATTVRVKRLNDGPQIHLPPYGTLEPLLQVRESNAVLLKGAPSIEELLTDARHLSSSASPKRTKKWNLMLAQPLAPDSTTRLTSLGTFPGSDAYATRFFKQLGGKILFSGRTELSGDELWESDGTATGTTLLKDIYPGPRGSEISFLTTFSADNRVYFAARGPDLSWRVPVDYRDSCGSFRQSAFDANVFFSIAQDNTWEPDQVYDCPLGYHWMSTTEAQAVFIGTVADNGHSREPLVYFDECGWSGYVWGGTTRTYLRFSDSRETGAYKHVGFRDSYRIGHGFQTDAFAGIVCYRDLLGGDDKLQQQQEEEHQIWGPELWATDGTAEGTRRVRRINSNVQGSSPSHFAEFMNRLYFQATSSESGAELWVTDGTRQGTLLVADIEPGSRNSEPKFLTVFDTHLVFSATTVLMGREPWISDGAQRTDFSLDHSNVGTGVLLDICPGTGPSNPKYFAELTTGPGATPLLLFQADDCVHGAELWGSGGSASTTHLIADIYSGGAGSNPSYLTAYGGRVYFQADDGVHGKELWSTDGTGAGTLLLADLAPGVAASAPSFLTVMSNLGPAPGSLLFAARAERDRMWEFWQSDGTHVGTTKLFTGSREVANINVEAMDAMPSPRFLSTSGGGGLQSFFYFGKQMSSRALRSSSFIHSNGDEVKTSVDTRSITLFDVESAVDEDQEEAAQYLLFLNCSKGFLSLSRQCADDGADLELLRDSQIQSAEITIKGSLRSLNCALEQVTYASKADASSGWDTIFVTLEQLSSSSSYEPDLSGDGRFYAVTKRIPIEIRAINDPPVIRMPSTYFAPLDAWADLSGIEVSDADAGDGLVFIQLKVHNGQLRLGREAAKLALNVGLGVPIGNSDSGSSLLEFAATVADAALIFQSLQYKCASVDGGCRDGMRDYLSVYVDDNGFTGDGGALDVTESAVVHVQSGALD